MKRHKTVEQFLAAEEKYHDELVKLRTILVSTPLEETIKWGIPCYTHKGKNVVGIAGFKNHFGLWFYQGALLKDEKSVLINAQEGKTKAMRQWRFTSGKEIVARTIKAYVKEAIELVEQGKEIKPTRNKKVEMPPELTKALSKNKKLKASFEKLTPGKQREYCSHIADAKRTETKEKRLEKISPMIMEGVGLHDKYKNC